MTKDELKCRISMALKDPVLQQGFEIICRENDELEKENTGLKADYEVLSCSVGDFEELQNRLEEEQRKNNGLSDNLTKAKELIRNIIRATWKEGWSYSLDWKVKAEQFLEEVEND